MTTQISRTPSRHVLEAHQGDGAVVDRLDECGAPVASAVRSVRECITDGILPEFLRVDRRIVGNWVRNVVAGLRRLSARWAALASRRAGSPCPCRHPRALLELQTEEPTLNIRNYGQIHIATGVRQSALTIGDHESLEVELALEQPVEVLTVLTAAGK